MLGMVGTIGLSGGEGDTSLPGQCSMLGMGGIIGLSGGMGSCVGGWPGLAGMTCGLGVGQVMMLSILSLPGYASLSVGLGHGSLLLGVGGVVGWLIGGLVSIFIGGFSRISCLSRFLRFFSDMSRSCLTSSLHSWELHMSLMLDKSLKLLLIMSCTFCLKDAQFFCGSSDSSSHQLPSHMYSIFCNPERALSYL